MRYCSVPPLLLALLWALASVAPLRAADDPGALFLQAYQTYQAGAKLELDGKSDEAQQKFRFCVGLLEQIQKNSPDYEPIVIDYRLKKSRMAIARVQSLQAPSAGDEAVETPPAAAPRPPPVRARTGFSGLTMTYRIPVPGEVVAAPTTDIPRGTGIVDLPDEVIGRGAINAYKSKIQSLQQQVEDLQSQLLGSTAREQSALTEVDRQKSRFVELQAQLAQAHQSLDDLQQTNDRLARDKATDQQHIASLESDLDAAHADLEVAEEYNGELFTKLERASKFIEADEKIRTQLLGERKQLNDRLDARASESARVAKAEKERDAAVAEKNSLQKQVDASVKADEQNQALATKLGAAEKQLADLSKNSDERRKIESGLRGEVESVTKSLATMSDQLKTGQTRITELEKQLADTASATAGVTGAMADENTLLKSLVVRQLQEQAKRQQARKLVEEEMQKLQVRSTSLLGKLDAMAGDETILTPQEKKLVDRPVASAPGHSDFALEVVKKMPESDLPPELVERAAQANEFSQKRQFAEARDIYAEIARKAPQSYLAAVNLGIAERQLGDYPQAITAFRRALELKPEDSFALTNLGTVEYRAGNLTDAVTVLKQAVAVDAESYLAHYLLGMAFNDQGDRDGALREVRKSLDLKPDYVPAMELAGNLDEKSGEKSSQNSISQPGR